MAHLSSFKVRGYRGLGDFGITDLAPVNLITGRNGIGKSSLLEAIFLFLNRFDPTDLCQFGIQRSQEPVTDPLARLAGGEIIMRGTEGCAEHSLTARYETRADPSQVAATQNSGNTDLVEPGALAALLGQGIPIVGVLHVSIDGKPPDLSDWRQTPGGIVLKPPEAPGSHPAFFVAAVAPAPVKGETIPEFSQVIKEAKKSEFQKDLRLVLPFVEDLEIVAGKGQSPYVLATVSDGSKMPLESLGSGMRRLFFLLLVIRMARGGAILIDEINAEFHHSVLEDLWRRVRILGSRLGVQVFATTHSMECVHAAIAAFDDQPDDLALHGLCRRADESSVHAVTFRGDTLQSARDLNLELR